MRTCACEHVLCVHLHMCESVCFPAHAWFVLVPVCMCTCMCVCVCRHAFVVCACMHACARVCACVHVCARREGGGLGAWMQVWVWACFGRRTQWEPENTHLRERGPSLTYDLSRRRVGLRGMPGCMAQSRKASICSSERQCLLSKVLTSCLCAQLPWIKCTCAEPTHRRTLLHLLLQLGAGLPALRQPLHKGGASLLRQWHEREEEDKQPQWQPQRQQQAGGGRSRGRAGAAAWEGCVDAEASELQDALSYAKLAARESTQRAADAVARWGPLHTHKWYCD